MLSVFINQLQVDYLSAQVERSIESFCGSFSVDLKANTQCKLNDEVEIFSEDKKVMTAIIEDISQPRDKSNFIISIRGRDKTGELIDSYMKPKQYRQKNWQECQGLLETLIGLWNGEIDTFYRELESRIQEYITSPPPDTWDGSLIKTVQ